MRITVNDPMPGLRDTKTAEVNRYFNTLAANNLHRDQAHAQKRAWAANTPEALAPEAALRGITVADLADLILSKPDTLADRELQRQKALAKVAAATSPAALVNVDI